LQQLHLGLHLHGLHLQHGQTFVFAVFAFLVIFAIFPPIL
jgi:hypothetical protein